MVHAIAPPRATSDMTTTIPQQQLFCSHVKVTPHYATNATKPMSQLEGEMRYLLPTYFSLCPKVFFLVLHQLGNECESTHITCIVGRAHHNKWNPPIKLTPPIWCIDCNLLSNARQICAMQWCWGNIRKQHYICQFLVAPVGAPWPVFYTFMDLSKNLPWHEAESPELVGITQRSHQIFNPLPSFV
jgi:hypothetical protein